MRKFTVLSLCSGMALMLFSMQSYAEQVTPKHGYVTYPHSRAYLCSLGHNKNCGPVQHEPQSVEGPKGFPAGGPPDGKIASAGRPQFSALDQPGPERWLRNNFKPNQEVPFVWRITAAHATENWRVFITKKNWDTDKPLARSQFDLSKPICEKKVDGSVSGNVETLKGCKIPSGYQGYHVLLAIWDIADTGNAFYQVVDANIRS